MALYSVTKLHTAGILAGLETTEVTSVPFVEGETLDAIGGGAYTVTRVREAVCPACGDTAEWCADFARANRYK